MTESWPDPHPGIPDPGPLQGPGDPRIGLFDLTGQITGLHNRCHQVHRELLNQLAHHDNPEEER